MPSADPDTGRQGEADTMLAVAAGVGMEGADGSWGTAAAATCRPL